MCLKDASNALNVIPLKLHCFLIRILKHINWTCPHWEPHPRQIQSMEGNYFLVNGACKFILIFKVIMGEM